MSEGNIATALKAASPRRKKAVPEGLREYLTRRELLVVVPLCMASIDALEKKGIFPRRLVLTPTRRVVWVREEVEAFLKVRARNRDKVVKRKAASAQQNTG